MIWVKQKCVFNSPNSSAMVRVSPLCVWPLFLTGLLAHAGLLQASHPSRRAAPYFHWSDRVGEWLVRAGPAC